MHRRYKVNNIAKRLAKKLHTAHRRLVFRKARLARKEMAPGKHEQSPTAED
jgi:hypothetical protein